MNSPLRLKKMERGEAVPILLEGLNSADSWIRWEAVNALRKLKEWGKDINSSYNKRFLRFRSVYSIHFFAIL